MTLWELGLRFVPNPALSLPWADSIASTFGCLYGSNTRKPSAYLSLAPRKSRTGFTAATVIGAAVAFRFSGFIKPTRNKGRDISWAWHGGIRLATGDQPTSIGVGGLLGLSQLQQVSWAVLWRRLVCFSLARGQCSRYISLLDLRSLDDDLTLSIISGGYILGLLKLLRTAALWLTSW